MELISPEFKNGGVIPDRFSQYRGNHSPPLTFRDVPESAGALALIVDDPDAKPHRFTHWVAFNIAPDEGGFGENRVPENVRHGRNDLGQAAYAGPKPPDGEHRYFFHAYALDRPLDLPAGASRKQVEDAMVGHVVDEAGLMGRFAPPQ